MLPSLDPSGQYLPWGQIFPVTLSVGEDSFARDAQ